MGVNWSNLFEPGSESSDEITMGTVWVMFIIDIIIYMLVTLYVSNVFPGPYGIPRPWNFPLEFLKGVSFSINESEIIFTLSPSRILTS